MAHDVDMITGYCRKCGAGVSDVIDGNRASQCEPGVIGISVKARGRAFGQKLGRALDLNWSTP